MLNCGRADKVSASITGSCNCRPTKNTERTFSWNGHYVARITSLSMIPMTAGLVPHQQGETVVLRISQRLIAVERRSIVS